MIEVSARKSGHIMKAVTLRQSGFRLLDDFCKCCRIVHRHIGKNLAIELDTGFFQSVHKCGVVHIIQTARCIDTDNPKFSEFSFFLFSVAVSVYQASLNLLFCFSEVFSSSAVEAFCKLHNFFVSSSSYNTGFYSWHIFSFLYLSSSRFEVPAISGLALLLNAKGNAISMKLTGTTSFPASF